VIENQIDPGYERRNAGRGIDVEPSDLAPRDRCIEPAQNRIIDGAGQARCPVLFSQLSRRCMNQGLQQQSNRNGEIYHGMFSCFANDC
jgi:hypothetical protein